MAKQLTVGTQAAPEAVVVELPQGWLSTEEAARYLGVSVAYVKKQPGLMKIRKKLPSLNGARPIYRFRATDLDKWIAAQNDPKRRAS